MHQTPDAHSKEKSSGVNLFLLPSANRNNKYMELLTTALRQYPHIHQIPLKSDTLWSVWCFLKENTGEGRKNVIHIQWSTVLYGSRFAVKSLAGLIINGCLLVVLKTAYHCKVVWTVHNTRAHDYPHPSVDTIGRWVVRLLADCIIVQQKITQEFYQQRYPKKTIYYIHHGNYIRAYGHQVSRDNELRRVFGFGAKDVVLLSLGAIAPYKRNADIIDAVVAAQQSRPDLKLLIAGKGPVTHVETLKSQVPPGAGIVIANTFVEDAEIPRYLAMADYAVFYYDESEMTSGAMILALSYGLPVIARAIPATEVVHQGNGYVFHTKEELGELLRGLAASNSPEMRSAIIADIEGSDWTSAAARLVRIYEQL
jgi:glycosyltransferase involved in cell wall biosynthesis